MSLAGFSGLELPVALPSMRQGEAFPWPILGGVGPGRRPEDFSLACEMIGTGPLLFPAFFTGGPGKPGLPRSERHDEDSARDACD